MPALSVVTALRSHPAEGTEVVDGEGAMVVVAAVVVVVVVVVVFSKHSSDLK